MRKLQDGDTVVLIEPARVDGYWYDPDHNPQGCWDSHFMLPGCTGTVVRAETPCVHRRPGTPACFANVDIAHNGVVSRIRVYHSALKRIIR